MHMMLEPLLLFEAILIEDWPIFELLDSDFSYRSDLLDAWYADGSRSQRQPPTAIPFHRVSITDRRYGGVIAQRGRDDDDVQSRANPADHARRLDCLSDLQRSARTAAGRRSATARGFRGRTRDLTLREIFAAHRTRPDCAGCHVKIDPLGFALENYGPTGVWRDQYENGREVDATGVLFHRHPFRDIVEFKDAILLEKERFAKAFVEHLLSFGLGRESAAVDSPAINSIIKSSAQSDFRFRAMIKQVVLSKPFLQKYNPGAGPTHSNTSNSR